MHGLSNSATNAVFVHRFSCNLCSMAACQKQCNGFKNRNAGQAATNQKYGIVSYRCGKEAAMWRTDCLSGCRLTLIYEHGHRDVHTCTRWLAHIRKHPCSDMDAQMCVTSKSGTRTPQVGIASLTHTLSWATTLGHAHVCWLTRFCRHGQDPCTHICTWWH